MPASNYADNNRKNIPARDCAHKKPRLDHPGTPSGATTVSHDAVKTALSLRPGKPNSGAKGPQARHYG